MYKKGGWRTVGVETELSNKFIFGWWPGDENMECTLDDQAKTKKIPAYFLYENNSWLVNPLL